MTPIRFVAIGLRIHGEYAIEQFLMTEGTKLVAIAETEHHWRAVSDRFQVPFYDDYLHLLDEQECDTVIVCLPNYQKADAIIECLKRGKNVISDKPIAVTEEDLRRIEDQVAVSQGQFSTLLTERFNPLYMKAKELVDAGKIGQVAGCLMMRPHEATIQREEPWMFLKEKNGGLIVDLMIHDIDLARWICQADVVEVTARKIQTNFFADKANYVDFAQALFVLERDITVHIEADWLTPANTSWDCRMLIVGSDGTIEVLTKSGEVIYCTHNENHDVVAVNPPVLDEVCQDFIRRIRGQQHQILSADECIKSARAVLMARESSETRQTVRSEG
ncbi:dehydrogenase [Paenibacillus baekrokdamisoli]|uniref:Dehydrogenase n=1 Tax=Paenibacillus baekrokdamisoli TaxID=1712516 RepID=A0A3G9J2G2_9BACL|nr:Gfo/Idh/MocA family oxidoreductase [Paenibacillus baekrokdamisoli]MBB3069480.1 putative dehydrogenase [Paenibacillus baekrokdamisoli]BBH24946.1 dehydrogenase [Paenibacillus baekrokdamisoli]